MGFFEKLLRGVAGSHGGDHHGRERNSGHHGWGNRYPSNSAPPTNSATGGPPCPKCGSATNPGGTLLRPMRHSLGAQQLCGLQCEPLPGY